MKNVPIRLAIADDNADNRLIVRTYLEDRYHIVEFSDGKEAVQGIKQVIRDVLLLDISLPDMDGLEVLRLLRAETPRLRKLDELIRKHATKSVQSN
jgi:CheY-like chemotaxis protein